MAVTGNSQAKYSWLASLKSVSKWLCLRYADIWCRFIFLRILEGGMKKNVKAELFRDIKRKWSTWHIVAFLYKVREVCTCFNLTSFPSAHVSGF